MTRQRLSRDQSREQTRDRLLEAAQTIFTKKGFENASVEDISAAAGYTRGAFYSNFGGKTELFIELLRRSHAGVKLEFDRIFEIAPDIATLEAGIIQYYSQLYRDDLCGVLWMEAKLLAIRDVKFRNKLNIFLTEKRAEIIDFLHRFSARTGVASLAPAEVLAVGLMSLAEGVSFAHRVDPQRVNCKLAEAALAWFGGCALFGPPPESQAESESATPTDSDL
jgi:AcrR family transcriptional regulator